MNRHPSSPSPRLRIAIDTKNLALYSAGIAAFFAPLLHAWIAARPQWDFVLIGPPFQSDKLVSQTNCRLHHLAWPTTLPRTLRHPYYDNLLFPNAIRSVQPQALFTPYHDVRLPTGIPSVMMVHDTCLHDLPEIYPFSVRAYYLYMLRRNLTIAKRVLTVSQASRRNLQSRYGVSDERTCVVPNMLDPDLAASPTATERGAKLRAERPAGIHIFYPGGSEHRKNITHLSQAIIKLTAEGESIHVWITGDRNAAWDGSLDNMSSDDAASFHFLGKLKLAELAAQYRACDTVVYPTLCEGFGRVVLEAMEMGAPVACSDLPVLHEVAADYPVYFDPGKPASIAAAVLAAANVGPQIPRRDHKFQPRQVTQAFFAQTDAVFEGIYPDL